MRPFSLDPVFPSWAEGVCLVSMGNTRVLCMVSVQMGVPAFLKGSGEGWVTAEYDMLPRATHQRRLRTWKALHPDGRVVEIGRFIGRSLRAAVDREALGETTWVVDCDVLQADGGTRIASVNGGMVALALAAHRLRLQGFLERFPIRFLVGGISAVYAGGKWTVDPDYTRDQGADMDLNVVFAEDGRIVEIQAAAEGEAVPPDEIFRVLPTLFEAVQTHVFPVQRAAIQEGLRRFSPNPSSP